MLKQQSKKRPRAHRVRRQMTQFFEATSDAIAFLDHRYVFTFMNRRAKEILAPGGDVLGLSLWVAFPFTAAPDSPYWINYHRTMDEGVATHFEAYYPEPLNLRFEIRTFPSVEGMILFFRDITEEHSARVELLQRREEMERHFAEIEAVYRTAPIGLALFDLDGYHYVRLNDRQAAYFGLKPEQVVGRTLMEMIPIDGLRELFDQVASGGPPVVNYRLEGTLATDPNNYRYWTVSYFPVIGSDGVVHGITAASLEITQQRKAELALIQSDKLAAVGRLASSIAHEINNPLESVTNLLYLAKGSDTLEVAKGYLASAEQELQRMSAITTQTLRFHKQSTSPQEITGKSLIESVLSIYQGRILNAGVTVSSRYQARHAVRCFEGEIRQVIANMLSNALDALAPGGTLFLRSREGTRYSTGERGVAITIADNGCGMSPEILQKAFQPFYTTKGIIGNGLGLWICKEILDRHHGTIQSRSRISRGTAFRIFMPFDSATR